jgi:hypothetical protein
VLLNFGYLVAVCAVVSSVRFVVKYFDLVSEFNEESFLVAVLKLFGACNN